VINSNFASFLRYVVQRIS